MFTEIQMCPLESECEYFRIDILYFMYKQCEAQKDEYVQ